MSRVAYVLGGCNNCQLNQLKQLTWIGSTSLSAFLRLSEMKRFMLPESRKQTGKERRGGKREEAHTHTATTTTTTTNVRLCHPSLEAGESAALQMVLTSYRA